MVSVPKSENCHFIHIFNLISKILIALHNNCANFFVSLHFVEKFNENAVWNCIQLAKISSHAVDIVSDDCFHMSRCVFSFHIREHFTILWLPPVSILLRFRVLFYCSVWRKFTGRDHRIQTDAHILMWPHWSYA